MLSFSISKEHGRVLPAESALQRAEGARLERRLTRALVRSGAAPPKDRNPVKKLGVQAGVFSDLPTGSADWPGPRIFVSVLDSSSLDEATDNFSFQGFAQDPCPAQHAPTASGQALVSAASEWQQMLEAAEALLILKQSSQAPSGSISPLQLCVAPAPAGDRGLQPPSPCLPPRLPSSVSQPLGHPACILLLS
ncbi:hypothetical protein mRhiFer1_007807 [Rhinolophus ferrumequinum]|uniref:Doublesex- and mab-3-related transcription factor C1/C2 C-terminal domain-containing protein n=1 Tax=Rhinolophus ferrumequinum TaxID=59479 RepID=A0A7J8AVJ1_RHIFE|nr:hypothetical protein mRhiFer1_007807 [Rhinolophus ferrumequinum]